MASRTRFAPIRVQDHMDGQKKTAPRHCFLWVRTAAASAAVASLQEFKQGAHAHRLAAARAAGAVAVVPGVGIQVQPFDRVGHETFQDRKSTRLNSSHPSISYAVFCLKKKKKKK